MDLAKKIVLAEETKLKISNTMRARRHLTSVYNTNIIEIYNIS